MCIYLAWSLVYTQECAVYLDATKCTAAVRDVASRAVAYMLCDPNRLCEIRRKMKQQLRRRYVVLYVGRSDATDRLELISALMDYE